MPTYKLYVINSEGKEVLIHTAKKKYSFYDTCELIRILHIKFKLELKPTAKEELLKIL